MTFFIVIDFNFFVLSPLYAILKGRNIIEGGGCLIFQMMEEGVGGKGGKIPRLGEGLNAGSKKNAKYLKIISLKENKLLGLIQVYTLNSFFSFVLLLA